MEILIALFFVAAIGFQVLNLIDWVISSIFHLFGLGIFPTREFVLKQLGYDPEQCSYADAYLNWECNQEIRKWSAHSYTYKYQR
jgi:hypothetical protein